MAYLNLLAAVPEEQVDRLRRDAKFLLRPTIIGGASHLLAYWVETQPLGQLLALAMDQGAVINADLWHPLRVPVYHLPPMVHRLYEQIAVASACSLDDDGKLADWIRRETVRLLRIYRRAADARECVVSVLMPPADEERAARVRNPVAVN